MTLPLSPSWSQIAWGRMLRYTLEEYELDLDVDSLIITLHCPAYVPDLVKMLSTTPKRYSLTLNSYTQSPESEYDK